MSVESMKPCNHLILCRPLLLLPSIFPSISVFSNESALHMRWAKHWSCSVSPSNEYSVLISIRADWLDLLAVQGTLKSLLQHYNWKASILWCPAFFIVQLSYPYMTTGKTIALTHSPRVSLPHRSESSTPVPSTPLVKSIGFADPVANPNSATWLLQSSPDRFVAKSSNDAAQTQSSHARNDSSYYLKRKAPDSSAWLWWFSMLSLLTTSQLSHSPTLNYCPTRSAGGPNMYKRMNLRFWGTRVGGCIGAYQPFHEHFTWAFLTNGLWEVSVSGRCIIF